MPDFSRQGVLEVEDSPRGPDALGHGRHAGVVERHEDGVDNDTDGDKHVDERVGDKEYQ